MKRFTAIVSLLVITAIVAAVNAAVFAYRWMQVSVSIAPATSARGAACTGFYSSVAQPGINLPSAGTNYNAITYGANTITISTGTPVCQWTHGGNAYSLYESIEVTIPLTVGSWYIKDFYGFGYNGTAADPVVYVYVKVEDLANEANIEYANLIIYKDGVQAATVDLKSGTITGSSIMLSPGEALQLDLAIKASAQTDATFRVGFYVGYSSREAPR
uniref:Uncharacterized protein n=1 Tax=Ignisphaera aggregans TaxID=334771 RepID=A0A7C4FH80_9CREN